jgi:hypothetical protein
MRSHHLHRLTSWTLAAICALALVNPAAAFDFPFFGGDQPDNSAQTQIRYLSGAGNDNTVDWEFYCTDGRNSEVWTTIPVPSCWESQGFGAFNYGRDLRKDGLFHDRATEQGLYKLEFSVPREWEGRRVDIVFDGVFTDTLVKINGTQAGPPHRGGFYRFKYDISALLNHDRPNLLEVTVDKMSSDESVNAAERAGDYWIFGGIYRPVYLESRPVEHIRHAAIAAQADGAFTLNADLRNIDRANRLRVTILDVDGQSVADPVETALSSAQAAASVATIVSGIQPWSAETPDLYHARVELLRGRRVLHTVTERFGFRTVEIRPGEGIFLNGQRIMFKGSNRHVFWPDSGRTVSRSIDELDVGVMKDMNMNAVRTSHYPSDESFIDVCDEQGLYALVELAGWHGAYSDEAGAPLVREMVERDVNHPSVIFWLNGNEGGTNMDLNAEFAANDPQGRPVLIPGEQRTWIHNNVITKHYPKYFQLIEQLEDPKAVLEREFAEDRKLDELRAMNLPDGGRGSITMPTEMLHGLYDGGHGSGLADFWDVMRAHKNSAGGFTWAYADEAVRRPDRFGAIDPHMTDAPDGIVGPYREKEGSFHAIKEIWSPVVIPMKDLPADFDGRIPVENRYDMTSLDRVRFQWRLVDWTGPLDRTAEERVAAAGTTPAPAAAPGETATLRLELPPDWRSHHALSLSAVDWTGREVLAWTWPIRSSRQWAEVVVRPGAGTVRYSQDQPRGADKAYHILECDSLLIMIDPDTGRLSQARHARQGRGKDRRIDFGNGPAMAGGDDGPLLSIAHRPDGNAHIIETTHGGDLKRVQWKLHPSGWIELTYDYVKQGYVDFLGVSFDFPERDVYDVRWLGNGPYRVWKNRLEGARFGLWEKAHNTSMTGHASWQYPEFRGYHGGVFWAMIETLQGRINVVDPRGDLNLRLYTPDYLADEMVQAPFPSGNISFMDLIPPIGQKFDPAYWPDGDFTRRHGGGKAKPFEGVFGPQSARPFAVGDYSRTLYLFFGVE